MRAILFCLLLTAACSPGGSSAPLSGRDVEPELVWVRSRQEAAMRDTETVTRSVRGLGGGRISPRAGRESGVRVDPAGERVVFARLREADEPGSTELFVAPIDNRERELRLTADRALDDGPCWSPDGETVLFSSDRGGQRALWRIGSNGRGLAAFLSGSAPDRDPDWHGPSDRIVFSRFDGTLGRWRLMLVNGDGTGATPLTGGGPVAGAGDRQPAWAADGQSVVFRRATGADRAGLWRVDLGGNETLLWDGGGDVRHPRPVPEADRIFAAVDLAGTTRPARRLAELPPDGGAPLLLQPDPRYDTLGCDVLPALGPRPPRGDPQVLPADSWNVTFEGTATLGSTAMLEDEDGNPLMMATRTFDGREIAGVNVRTRVPVPADEVLELHVRMVAALRRTGGDSALRVVLRDQVERRNDTVVETMPSSTAYRTLEFTTGSLAHVDRDGWISTAVIADVEPGARTELWVDAVTITVVGAARPVAK